MSEQPNSRPSSLHSNGDELLQLGIAAKSVPGAKVSQLAHLFQKRVPTTLATNNRDESLLINSSSITAAQGRKMVGREADKEPPAQVEVIT